MPIGMLSNHLMTLLHLGQKDRSNTTPLSCGNLKIQTLEKLTYQKLGDLNELDMKADAIESRFKKDTDMNDI